MSRLYLSNPCAFLTTQAHTAMRAQSAPGFPCALRPRRERTRLHHSDNSCRENVLCCFLVIASAAKQSSFAATRKLDCFVASLPRNDRGGGVRSPSLTRHTQEPAKPHPSAAYRLAIQ